MTDEQILAETVFNQKFGIDDDDDYDDDDDDDYDGGDDDDDDDENLTKYIQWCIAKAWTLLGVQL